MGSNGGIRSTENIRVETSCSDFDARNDECNTRLRSRQVTTIADRCRSCCPSRSSARPASPYFDRDNLVTLALLVLVMALTTAGLLWMVVRE